MSTQKADLQIFAVNGIKEVQPGDDLTQLIINATTDSIALQDCDCVVITQKVISKAEGRLVVINPSDPSSYQSVVEVESLRVLRRRGDLVISETVHGFVCANAGVDRSNVTEGYVTLLPMDSDRSARRIQENLKKRLDVEVGVVITDTFGRPWRRGVTDVAIGCSGIAALIDLRGTTDALGQELTVTEVAVADEIAAAADLIMGKADNVPVVVVRGLNESWFRDSSVTSEIVRSPNDDLFR